MKNKKVKLNHNIIVKLFISLGIKLTLETFLGCGI